MKTKKQGRNTVAHQRLNQSGKLKSQDVQVRMEDGLIFKLKNELGTTTTTGKSSLFGKKDIFIVSLEILGILVNFI